jgi:branched-chain amino acid aminotransferase
MSLGSKTWMNGAVFDAQDAHVSAFDRGFTLGDGLFETMLWTGSEIRFFDDHMARLTKSAAALGLEFPLPVAEVQAGLNALAQGAKGQMAALRLTLSRGSGPRGLSIPSTTSTLVIVTIAPFVPLNASSHLKTVSIRRNCGAPSARFKTLSYIDNIMALEEAKAKGGDHGILYGTTGYVACTTSANIILAHKGRILTPAVEDGALAGIVRGRLLAAGLVEEAPIDAHMLATCDHCVLTNALIGIGSVATIDGRTLRPNGDLAGRLGEALLTS